MSSGISNTIYDDKQRSTSIRAHHHLDKLQRNERIRLYRVAGVENPIMRRAYPKELGVNDEALETIIPESQNIVLVDLPSVRIVLFLR
jgi:hypothetical protein